MLRRESQRVLVKPSVTGEEGQSLARIAASLEALAKAEEQSFFLCLLKDQRGLIGQISTMDELLGEAEEEIERVAMALSNAARVRVLHALLGGEKTAAALMAQTKLAGGQLYHHLKELSLTQFIGQRGRLYYITPRGKQALVSIAALSRILRSLSAEQSNLH